MEAEGYGYVIRLPANAVHQHRIAHLLTRPVGRPPHEVRRSYASFRYQAQTWSRSRRVVAKVEWHPGELYPRVGFVDEPVPPARIGGGLLQWAEQWIREGKNAVRWTRLSCRSMKADSVRLQLHALAYNLANFFRTLVLPDEIERWSPITLREKVVKIGAKVITHARYTVFQMAEVEVPSSLLRRILAMIDDLRPRRIAPCCTGSQKQLQPPTKLTEGVCPKWCLMGGAGAGWRTRAGSRAYRAAQAISQSLDRNRIRVSLGVARSGFEGRSGA